VPAPGVLHTPCRVVRISHWVQLVQRGSETTSFGWGDGIGRLMRRFALVVASVGLAVVSTAATASALPAPSSIHGEQSTAGSPARSTPVSWTGPSLRVPADLLAQSMVCSPNLETAGHKPVLFIHGTFVDPVINFSWNYQRAFDADHRPYCLLTMPNRATSDIQISAEYVVYAIRTMHQRSGHKVDIIGHSQGGMIGRWATKFWPDTRRMVDDIVGLAPSNHGINPALCQLACQPAVWQQTIGSRFLTALNAGQETFAGISYTVVYTRLDEIVTPNLDHNGLSALHTGAGLISNVATQDICATNTADHLSVGTSDPVGYALAINAIDHPGPADPARIDRSVCAQLLHPGVDPVTFPANAAVGATSLAVVYATYPRTLAEPPLMSYSATAGPEPRPSFTDPASVVSPSPQGPVPAARNQPAPGADGNRAADRPVLQPPWTLGRVLEQVG
jgi:pimeloyl-ACP methyl ester carboxylesterase